MSGPHVSLRGIRIAVYAAEAGTVLLAGGAFLLSFTALRDLAERSGIDPGLGWLWPLIVDGIIIVATISVFALAGVRVVWYPWLLLIGGAGVSVAANAIHAVVAAPDIPGVLAAAVASVPPIVLVASTHLTAILLRHSRTVLTQHNPARQDEPHESDEMPSAAAREEAAALGAAGQAAARELEPHPTAGVSGVAEEDARLLLVHRLRAEKLTNAQIARVLGVHRSTVGRIAAKPLGFSPAGEMPPEAAVSSEPEPDEPPEGTGVFPESNEQEPS